MNNKVLFHLEACFDLISRSSLHMKIQIMGRKIDENLGFKLPLRKVNFFTQFSLWLRLMLQTIYVLKTEILQFLSLKSAAYKQERLQIVSGL